MNILMIIPEDYFQPKGTPFSAYNRALVLSRLGNRVDIITYPFGEDKKITGVRLYRCAKFPFVNSVKSGPSFSKVLIDIPLAIDAFSLLLRNRYDVVYSHEEAAAFGGLFGRILRKKTVYDMHSYIPELFEEWEVSRSRLFYDFGKLLLRVILSLSDAVVTNCVNLTEKVHEIKPSKKVFTIENAAVMQGIKTRGSAAALRKELGIKHEYVVMYTGSFVSLQNLDLLLRSVPLVVKKNRKVKFVLVGAKNQEEYGLHKKRIDELGIGQFVVLRMREPPERIPLYLDIADAVVSPRAKGINVPFKIYSLMESGKPIVASRSKLYNSFLDDSNAMLASPTPEGFAEAIIKIIRDRKLGKKLAANALLKVRKEYSYAAYYKKMEKLFGELNEKRQAQ